MSKKLNLIQYLLFILMWSNCLPIVAQVQCFPEGISFTSQAEIDDFAATTADCLTISGSVNISGVDIENLQGLSNIQSIEGNLIIKQNQILFDLSGLDALSTVNGNIQVHQNDSLRTLRALDNLHTLDGDLDIYYNIKLEHLPSFQYLERIGGNLSISYVNSKDSGTDLNEASSLTSVEGTVYLLSMGKYLNGLNKLQRIGGNLEMADIRLENTQKAFSQLDSIHGTLHFLGVRITNTRGMNKLTYIGGDCIFDGSCDVIDRLRLNNLKSIEGNLEFNTCSSGDLQDLTTFDNLEYLGGSLVLSKVYSLRSLHGLHSLREIGGDLSIQSSYMTFFDFSSLEVIHGSLIIGWNDYFRRFEGLNNLREIKQNFKLRDNPRFDELEGLESLKRIGGDFLIEACDQLNTLEGLEQLEEVGQEFKIFDNSVLQNLNGLDGLTEVQDLIIQDNWRLESISGLEQLTSIHGNLFFHKNPFTSIAVLANLSTIGGNLTIWNTDLYTLDGLQNIDTIGASLNMTGNRNFQSFAGLENLEHVGEHLTIRDFELLNLAGIEKLSSIGGTLYIYSNSDLLSIEKLQTLSYVGGDIRIENNFDLPSLKGLDNIEHIFGDLLIDTSPIKDLSGLEQLKSVRGNVQLIKLWQLENLHALSNLHTVGYLQLSDLDQLTDLVGLDQLYSIENGININSCDNLSYCNVPAICRHLRLNGSSYIINNGSGCNTEAQIRNNCTSETRLHTAVFYDVNRNGQRDSTENLLSNIRLRVQSGAETSLIYPDAYWLNSFEAGDYQISIDDASLENWELTTSPTVYNLSLSGLNNYDTISFGLYPRQEIISAHTNLHAPPLRCNESVNLEVNIRNTGTSIIDGWLFLELDERLERVEFTNPPDTVINENSFAWQVDSIYPSVLENRTIEVLVPGPPDFELGENLGFTTYFRTSFQDTTDLGHFYNEYPIRCSYDPNDKLIFPNREDKLNLFKEELNYTIRFQNTGNDFAYHITIKDILDTNLDLSTFQFVSTSHPEHLQIKLSEEGELDFTFRNIFLPDSTSNLEGSQGYVSYRIRTLEGLEEYTPIRNTASIYFDANPPIVTNTTENIMVSQFPVTNTSNLVDLPFKLYPTPAREIINLVFDRYIDGMGELMDCNGKLLFQFGLTQNRAINVSHIPSGIYFIRLITEEGYYVQKVIKAE